MLQLVDSPSLLESYPVRSVGEEQDFIQSLMPMSNKLTTNLQRTMCKEELDILVGLFGSPSQRYLTLMVKHPGSTQLFIQLSCFDFRNSISKAKVATVTRRGRVSKSLNAYQKGSLVHVMMAFKLMNLSIGKDLQLTQLAHCRRIEEALSMCQCGHPK